MKDKERSAEIEDIKPLMKKCPKSLLTPGEERSLIYDFQNSPDPRVREKALNELVRKNLRLVVAKAKQYMGKGIRLEDLVQEGATGLVRAAEKFDLDKNLRFSTYANWWIMQRVSRSIENKSKLVKIPINVLAKITELNKVYMAYIEEHNKPPTSEELAKILGITEKKAKEYGRMRYDYVSLDAAIGEDENLSMVDYLIDEDPLPEESTESLADKTYVSYLLNFLTKEDSNFIKLKYGFVDHEERSDKQMAAILKITIKEVKEKEAKVLAQLKEKADMFKVNISIPCSLVIQDIPNNKYSDVVDCLSKMLNLDFTRTRIMIVNLPSTVVAKVDQHLALSYKEELEKAGAIVEIVKFV